MDGVTAGGPGLVAVGHDVQQAAVWTSPDGVTWSRVPHDEPLGGLRGKMYSVTAGGRGLVAVGEDLSSNLDDFHDDAAVWTSPDGVTWSRVPHDEAVFGGAGNQSMKSVTAGGPGLVAVGSDMAFGLSSPGFDAAVWTSLDGLVWLRVPDDEGVFGGSGTQVLDGVIVGESGVVAVGHEKLGDDDDAAVWAGAPPD